MCKGMMGKKLGMSGLFTPQGRYIPVTVLQVGPCVVTQIKTTETDGYNALQLGFGERKPSHVNKPTQGHLKPSGRNGFKVLREFPVDDPQEFSVGQEINLDMFTVGERVNVVGRTKGRGFSGVIKRHGFGGGRKTHGSKSHRIPGSIGCSAWPAKVIRGKKMPGQYGNDRQMVRNLEIVDIRTEQNLLLVKGPVPGATSGLVEIRKLKFSK